MTAAAVERARLVVTELVDNAVCHAGSDIRVRANTNGRSVRIEVADGDPDLPEATEPAPDALSGRGLWLVTQLADDWGTGSQPPGKVVWAVVRW